MKRTTILLSALLLCGIGLTSCKNKMGNFLGIDTGDTAKLDTSSDIIVADTLQAYMAQCLNQNPKDVNFWDNGVLMGRLRNMLGEEELRTIEKNFIVETPITEEDSVYRIAGKKSKMVSLFDTSIFYDAKNDNLNVFVSRRLKDKNVEQIFIERDSIQLPKKWKEQVTPKNKKP